MDAEGAVAVFVGGKVLVGGAVVAVTIGVFVAVLVGTRVPPVAVAVAGEGDVAVGVLLAVGVFVCIGVLVATLGT